MKLQVSYDPKIKKCNVPLRTGNKFEEGFWHTQVVVARLRQERKFWELISELLKKIHTRAKIMAQMSESRMLNMGRRQFMNLLALVP